MCGFANRDESVTAPHCVKNNGATANLGEQTELQRLVGDICHKPCFLTVTLLAFGSVHLLLRLTVPCLSG